MKIEELLNCSFPNWYNNFKSVTVKSLVIPLSCEFIAYILQDSIFLPESNHSSKKPSANHNDSSDEDEDNWDDETEEPVAPSFPELETLIRDAILSLGGKAFPKLDWSSPRDASWIGFNNTCCCTSPSDVFLLLKSSDFIIQDLTQRLPECEDYADHISIHPQPHPFHLVLRKWIEVDTSGEFRCFVKDNTLIGISQREISLYFGHIGQYEDEIVENIVTFFGNRIQNKFANANYSFDVYIKKRGHVILLDFHPFDESVDSLMFSWPELKEGSVKPDENGRPEFRFVDENRGVQPTTLSLHALPIDVVDITTGTDSFKLVDLLRLKVTEQNEAAAESEDSDENWTV